MGKDREVTHGEIGDRIKYTDLGHDTADKESRSPGLEYARTEESDSFAFFQRTDEEVTAESARRTLASILGRLDRHALITGRANGGATGASSAAAQGERDAKRKKTLQLIESLQSRVRGSENPGDDIVIPPAVVAHAEECILNSAVYERDSQEIELERRRREMRDDEQNPRNEPWQPLQQRVTVVGGNQLIREARELDEATIQPIDLVANRLAPYVLAMEEQDVGSPVERADVLMMGMQRVFAVTEFSRARTFIAVRQSLRFGPAGPRSAGDFQTVGIIADYARKRSADELVVATALYGEILCWMTDPDSSFDHKATRGLALMQAGLNNVVSGLMTYLRSSNTTTSQVRDRAIEIFGWAVAVGVRSDRIDVTPAGIRALQRFGLYDHIQKQSPEEPTEEDTQTTQRRVKALIASIDRRTMVSDLSGMRDGSEDAKLASLYLELVASVIRYECGDDENQRLRSPSSFFNAGVSMARIEADERFERLSQLCRIGCNVLGVSAAIFSTDNLPIAIARYEANDCLVNLSATLGIWAHNGVDTKDAEYLAVAASLAAPVLAMPQLFSAEDKDRLKGSLDRITKSLEATGNAELLQSLIQSSLQTGLQDYGMRVYQVVVETVERIRAEAKKLGRELEPFSFSQQPPEKGTQGDYLAQATDIMLRTVLATEGFSSDYNFENESYERYAAKFAALADGDWERSNEIVESFDSLRDVIQRAFPEIYRKRQTNSRETVFSGPLPDLLVSDQDDVLDESWGRVRKWAAQDPPTLTAAVSFLREEMESAV